MENIAAGIDFGTFYSKIAVFRNGKEIMIPNSMGDPFTPSIVAFLDEGEIIGEETTMHKTEEKNTITEIKRIIGKNINDLKDLKEINYNISYKNDKLQIKINRKGKDEFYTPEQIISLIFKKLINNASDFVESPITNAVITVPVDFNDKQKLVIEEAAKLAGIDVLEIISEPVAAALSYGLGNKAKLKDSLFPEVDKKKINKKKVLVFDLGGSKFDVSILIVENNEILVKMHLGDNNLGGIDFDNKLINYCINDFCQKMGIDEKYIRKDENAMKRLRIQCEKGKKKLNKNDSTIINVYNFVDNLDLYVEINKDKFNDECEDLYQKIENLLDKILIDSTFKSDDIDDIILVGGSSKIPKIKELIEDKFDSNKIKDKINQDDAIVIGAARKAQKLVKNKKLTNNLESLPYSIGVGTVSTKKEERANGQIMSVLIPKNSKLPAKSVTKRYKTIKDNQSFFKIKVYSGEEYYIKNNKLIGEFKIDNLPPGKAKSVSFIINFEIGSDEILCINAEVESTNTKITQKYPLKNNQNQFNPLKKNPEINTNLDEIRKNVKNINDKNNALNNIENDEEKIKCLNELCELCIKILNIYENLKKENDSGNFYEKIIDYTKLLFKYYSQIIILDKEDKVSTDIINKIKEEIPKFINDNIENFIESFEELKNEIPKKYVEIILFCVEMLFKEGDKILEERKKYARYYSKKFYQKAENIKKFINDDLKKQMDYKLINKLKDIEKKYQTKVGEIESFVNLIKEQVNEKNTQFLPKKTGFTAFSNFIQKGEDTHTIVDIFQEMADCLLKGEVSEAEAYCRANIIKINFYIFKNYDFKLYERLNKRIEFIYDRLEIDEEDEPDWHKQLTEINEEIEKKRIEIENIKNKKNEEINKTIININNIFKEKIEDNNKPMEFIDFILENYPYNKFDSSKKEELKQKSFEEIFEIIFPKYHPDNYKDRDDFIIYHEIYMLLVKIEEKFCK